MGKLQDFSSKSFVEQMLLLDAVERDGDVTAVDDLFAILGNPSTDASLRQAVSDTLRSVLRKNPDQVLRGLALETAAARRVAVQLAGELGLNAAAPRLVELTAVADTDELLDVYAALSLVAGKETLGAFRKGAAHPEPLISALCIQQLAVLGDTAALPLLVRLLNESEAEGKYEFCTVTTQAAIEALTKLGTPEATEALIRKLHHKNPTARRLIHAALVEKGAAVIDRLARFFTEGTADEQIMAANLFGFIGHTKGADVLVGVMDRGGISNPNVRFAILEAFGRIPSLKGLVCLVDALQDPDDMILVAVATGLNHGSNPGAVLKISELLAKKDAQSRRVARAIASARATGLFTSLYENPDAAQILLEALAEIRDRDTVDTFREVLAKMGSQRAKDDLERLFSIPVEQSMRRVLAVDDSKSVLLFYKTIVSDLGFEVLTAGNGREALDVLEQDPAFDLIITDLNMPEMDGIELTRKIRENFMLSGLPIIMATTESEGSQIQIARNAGVNGFLSKPITPPSIGAMLKDVLG